MITKIIMSLMILLAAPSLIQAALLKDKMMLNALSTLGADLKRKMSSDIKSVSVYAVLRDSKKRYSDVNLKKEIEKMMRTAGYSIPVRGEAQSDAAEEQALSASGVIDVNAVKQAGMMSGIDAFFFIYPSVSGIFGERVSITVKGVNVATGAVIFAKEYSYEERPIVGVEVIVGYPVYSTYKPQGTIHVDPVAPAAWTPWTHDIALSRQNVTSLLSFAISLNMKGNGPSLRIGNGSSGTFDLGSEIIVNKLHGTNSVYTANAYIPVQTMKNDSSLYADITFPLSKLWGDRQNILRGYVGAQMEEFGVNKKIAVTGSEMLGLGTISSSKLPIITWLVRGGLEWKIYSGFCLTTACVVSLPWETPLEMDGQGKGIGFSLKSPLGVEAALGIVYRLF